MLNQEQGERLFRLLWVSGVRSHVENPKETWVAPWEAMRQWERDTASQVYQKVAAIIADTPSYLAVLHREQGGKLVRAEWLNALAVFYPEAKASYRLPWAEMPEWERETDRCIFEGIRAGVIPGELVRQSGDKAVELGCKQINQVYKIALAGPYIGDDKARFNQKFAALGIVGSFAVQIVESLKEVEQEQDGRSREEQEKYTVAREVASGFLAQVRMSLVNPDLVKRSERVAELNGWYPHEIDFEEALDPANWTQVDNLHTPTLDAVLFDEGQELLLVLPTGDHWTLQRGDIEALTRFLQENAGVEPLAPEDPFEGFTPKMVIGPDGPTGEG